MTTHPNDAPPETPPPPRTWGAPVPVAERPNHPWSTRKIVLSAVVAVVIVAGGTVGVIAATNHSASATGTNGGPGRFGGGGFGGRFGAGGQGGVASGLANALHGDFVVSRDGTTDRLQTGTVTSVSPTSVTVTSADGYTQSYVVSSGTSVDNGTDTISNVAKGNTVTIIATVSGNTATASTIQDRTLNPNAGPPNAGGPPPGN